MVKNSPEEIDARWDEADNLGWSKGLTPAQILEIKARSVAVPKSPQVSSPDQLGFKLPESQGKTPADRLREMRRRRAKYG